MDVRKQELNGFEAALFNQAFSRNIFSRPKIGDVWLIHEHAKIYTFYFNLAFYNKLKYEMQQAYNHLSMDWRNLIIRLLNAVYDYHTPGSFLDRNRVASIELEHKQFLQKFNTTHRNPETRLDLAKQIIVTLKDENDRPLEAIEYNNEGTLFKMINYKYLDGEDIVDKTTLDMSGYIPYSFLHRYKNGENLEEWIFIGGELKTIDKWVYNESGKLVNKISFPSF